MFSGQFLQAGFTGLGDAAQVVDYVRAGDVIRVSVAWYRATASWVFDPTPIYTSFKAKLGTNFNVVAMQPTSYWLPGGVIVVDIQTRGDFSRLNDVVSIVASNAQSAGLDVNVSATRGEFVSRAQTTGGNLPNTLPDPKTDNSAGKSVEDFIGNLTSSPVTLAVILGAAVVLVIAAKK